MSADLRTVQAKLRRLRKQAKRAKQQTTLDRLSVRIKALAAECRAIEATLPPRHRPPVGSAPDAPPPQTTPVCPRCGKRHKGRCGGWVEARRESDADLRPVRLSRKGR